MKARKKRVLFASRLISANFAHVSNLIAIGLALGGPSNHHQKLDCPGRTWSDWCLEDGDSTGA